MQPITTTINGNTFEWHINPQFRAMFEDLDLNKLAQRFGVTIEELNGAWNRGAILVFEDIGQIVQYYNECNLNCYAIHILKEELKNKTVIYTQHKFFMW